MTPAELPGVLPQPGPAWGDSMGGMTIAGGIAAALLKRERTGEPSVVDVSLLSAGMWALSATIALSLQMKRPWSTPMPGGAAPGNPLVGTYETSDGRYLSLVMLQGFHYWPDFCEHIERPDLARDPRFDGVEKLAANASEAAAILREILKTRTMAEWTRRFQTLKGQWAPVQNALEVVDDPQVRENGYMARTATKQGVEFDLVTTPVQFDEQPGPTARAPEFNEHGDEILQELGMGHGAHHRPARRGRRRVASLRPTPAARRRAPCSRWRRSASHPDSSAAGFVKTGPPLPRRFSNLTFPIPRRQRHKTASFRLGGPFATRGDRRATRACNH